MSDGQQVTIDGITYQAQHIAGDVWAMVKVGKRGQLTKAHRPATVRGEVVRLHRWVR